jgi:hypothetical protein
MPFIVTYGGNANAGGAIDAEAAESDLEFLKNIANNAWFGGVDSMTLFVSSAWEPVSGARNIRKKSTDQSCRPGTNLGVIQLGVVTGDVDLAHLVRSAKLAPAILRLKLCEKFLFLLHDAKAIIEVIIPGTRMFEVQNLNFLLTFPLLWARHLDLEFCAQRGKVLQI